LFSYVFRSALNIWNKS